MDPNARPDRGDNDHEGIVADFFESLETEEAPESASEPSEEVEAPDPTSPTPEAAENAAEGDEDEDEDDESDEELDAVDPKDDEPALDWEKRYKDQQSFHDKQMAEMRTQLDQLNQWAQNVYQQQLLQAQQAQQAPQQPSGPVNVSDAQIAKALDAGEVESAFVYIAQNAPHKMPALVAAARKHEKLGDDVADAMLFEYQSYREQQLTAQMQQQEQARQQAEAERQAPIQIQQQMASMIEGLQSQYGEAFEAVQDQFVERARDTAPAFREYMQNQGLAMSPEAVHYFLTKTLNDVREENLAQQAAKPKRARKLKPTEHAEGSKAGKGSNDEPTADEQAINELLQGARELNIDVTLPTS